LTKEAPFPSKESAAQQKGQDDRFRLTGGIHVLDRAVRLPRLGAIRLKEASRVQGRVLSATVSREADRWYVSLAVEAEMPDPAPVEGRAAGIDVGLSHFAAIVSGGEVCKIEAPKPLNRAGDRGGRPKCERNVEESVISSACC
jgi:putative transposase